MPMHTLLTSFVRPLQLGGRRAFMLDQAGVQTARSRVYLLFSAGASAWRVPAWCRADCTSVRADLNMGLQVIVRLSEHRLYCEQLLRRPCPQRCGARSRPAGRTAPALSGSWSTQTCTMTSCNGCCRWLHCCPAAANPLSCSAAQQHSVFSGQPSQPSLCDPRLMRQAGCTGQQEPAALSQTHRCARLLSMMVHQRHAWGHASALCVLRGRAAGCRV